MPLLLSPVRIANELCFADLCSRERHRGRGKRGQRVPSDALESQLAAVKYDYTLANAEAWSNIPSQLQQATD
jgi:hypothetical protein